ncbi:MAG: hypothetical protein JWP95_1146, partial [Actinotalea sp.]|nr:hypothetical protein [Actinotalea sp.]
MAAGPHDDERPDDPPADEPAEGARSGDLPTSPEEVEARWREIVSQLDDLGDLAGPEAAGGPTQPSTALPRGRPGRPLRRPGPA